MVLSQMGCNDLFFCRDGFIKAFLREDLLEPEQKFSKLIDIENAYKKTEKGRNGLFLSFLNNNIVLEKDLTFGEFIQCLRPWENEISQLLSIDIKSFFNSTFENSTKTYSSDEYFIQIANVGSIFRDVVKKKSQSQIELLKSLGFDVKQVREEDLGKWNGSYISEIRKNEFSLVKHNDPVVWYSIFEGFYGLKDLKLIWLKSTYLFFEENNFSGDDVVLTSKDLSKGNLHQNYQILKLEGNGTKGTLNDILISLFSASPEFCSPLSINTMIINKMLSGEKDLNKIDQEILKESKKIQEKYAGERKEEIDLIKSEFQKIDREDINNFNFDYENDNDKKFVFADCLFNTKK